MLWMYCIEASAGIYKSTRLGRQSSPRYIWQFMIRISTTTNYTLILSRSHSGSTAVTAEAPQTVRLEKKPKAGANELTSPRSHNVGVMRMLRLERKPVSNSCGW